jgi:hypothetical protein
MPASLKLGRLAISANGPASAELFPGDIAKMQRGSDTSFGVALRANLV